MYIYIYTVYIPYIYICIYQYIAQSRLCATPILRVTKLESGQYFDAHSLIRVARTTIRYAQPRLCVILVVRNISNVRNMYETIYEGP